MNFQRSGLSSHLNKHLKLYSQAVAISTTLLSHSTIACIAYSHVPLHPGGVEKLWSDLLSSPWCDWHSDLQRLSQGLFRNNHWILLSLQKVCRINFFCPGCLSMMSRSILRLGLAARTIASFVFVGDCLKLFKTISTNNHKLE